MKSSRSVSCSAPLKSDAMAEHCPQALRSGFAKRRKTTESFCQDAGKRPSGACVSSAWKTRAPPADGHRPAEDPTSCSLSSRLPEQGLRGRVGMSGVSFTHPVLTCWPNVRPLGPRPGARRGSGLASLGLGRSPRIQNSTWHTKAPVSFEE